jgi:predicted nucleic-acid-binding protein
VIALDTNVLVRFLVEDDPEQTQRATSLIERAVKADDELFITDIVLCELVWVLSGAYGFGRPDIVNTLKDLARARHLRFPDSDALVRALNAYERGRADFADYLIREQARRAGCDSVATFDKALLNEPAFLAP